MKKILCVTILILILSCASNKDFTRNYPKKFKSETGLIQGEEILVKSEANKYRKVIYDVYFSLESNKPDSVIKNIQILTKSYEGYIVNSSKNNIKIRIPSNKATGIINDIETLAEVVDKYISGKDVTEEYIDLGIKIDNIEKARKRYLELLAKAENVSAALKVEKELERLQRELDLLKGRENKLSHLIEYITIDIDVNIAVRPGPIGYIFLGLYKAVKWLFVW